MSQLHGEGCQALFFMPHFTYHRERLQTTNLVDIWSTKVLTEPMSFFIDRIESFHIQSFYAWMRKKTKCLKKKNPITNSSAHIVGRIFQRILSMRRSARIAARSAFIVQRKSGQNSLCRFYPHAKHVDFILTRGVKYGMKNLCWLLCIFLRD